MKKNTASLLAVATLAAASLAAPRLDASTVGYWRFEDGAFLNDSSGNGLTLNATGDTFQTEIPGTGPGSSFYNPVPLTGAANLDMVRKPGGSSNSYLHTAQNYDAAANGTLQTFTFEMMFHSTGKSSSSSTFLASYGYTGAANQRGWTVHSPSGATAALDLRISATGTAFEIIDSGFTITTGVDYYMAVAVDLTGETAAERSVTFYLQNLTAGDALQSNTITNITTESIFNPETPLAFGAQSNGSNVNNWASYMDEIRLSNTALSQSQLLVTPIPEPATYALFLGLAIVGMLLIKRRSRG